MPELPEAETIVRGLRATVVGERIRRVGVPRPDVLRAPAPAFARAVRGQTVRAVERRGKNVLLPLDSGAVLAVNLGMTGRLLPFSGAPRGTNRPTHPAVIFHFASGGRLVFDDVRRFGTVECLDHASWADRSRAMGPEPLSPTLTGRRLADALARSRSPIRSWLLDQRRIAGVGNIYANEALHLAGIHPLRPADSLGPAEAGRLLRALRRVLRRAIEARGTTLRDYRDANGEPGVYAVRLHAYGRAGEWCRCRRSRVERIVFGSRSAFFCQACQPAAPGGGGGTPP